MDGREVTYEAYENLLQRIGVLVKARNFLVFQGDVESVAAKSPLELTKLLEQISGSDQLRIEYEDLLKKKDESEEMALFAMQKKKIYVTQRREVKEQKDEAESFQNKRRMLEDLMVRKSFLIRYVTYHQNDILIMRRHGITVSSISIDPCVTIYCFAELYLRRKESYVNSID